MAGIEVPEWLPAFDKVLVEWLLPTLGVTAPVVLGLVTLAFSLKSWSDGLRSTACLGRQGYDAAVGVARRLGPGGVYVASLATVPILVAEGIVVAIVFVLANFVSVFVAVVRTNGHLEEAPAAAEKMRLFEQAWSTDGLTSWVPLLWSGGLELDIPAAVVLLVAALGLIGAYRSSHRSVRSSAWWALVVSFPVSVWLCLGAPFLALALVLQAVMDGGLNDTDAESQKIATLLVTTVYYAIMVGAAAGMQILSGVWGLSGADRAARDGRPRSA